MNRFPPPAVSEQRSSVARELLAFQWFGAQQAGPREVVCGNHKDIPGAANCTYCLAGIVFDIELATEPADEHIETPVEWVERSLRDAVGQVLAGENDARR